MNPRNFLLSIVTITKKQKGAETVRSGKKLTCAEDDGV